MYRRAALSSALVCLVVILVVAGCREDNAGMQARWIVASADPDYDSPYVFNVDPHAGSDSPSEHPGAVPFRIDLFVEPAATPAEFEEPDPIIATFGFVSDGLSYWQGSLGEDGEGQSSGCAVRRLGLGEGDDTSFVYAVWTQVPQGDEEDGEKVWYSQFTLDSGVSDYYRTFMESNLGSTNTSSEEPLIPPAPDLGGLGDASQEVDMFVNRGLVMWDPEAVDGSGDFFIPLVFFTTVGLDTTGIRLNGEIEPPDGLTPVAAPVGGPYLAQEVFDGIFWWTRGLAPW